MARYSILSWNGIPAQVRATGDDGRRVSHPLPDWFQQEIDRVAMRDGLAGSDAYLEAWTWSATQVRPGTAADVAAEVAAELEAGWSRAR